MIIAIISFIVVLAIIIFVHELGHFISAKRLGIGVDEFGLGFPPRAIGIQKKEDKWRLIKSNREVQYDKSTIYSLNWIPFGGFVKIKGSAGEEKKDERYDESDSFEKQKVWKRFIVLAAGVFMNIVVAAVFLAIAYMIGLPTAIGDDNSNVIDPQIQVYEVKDGMPAFEAGMKTGDVILAIDENYFTNYTDLVAYQKDKAGQDVVVKVSRFAEEININLTLTTNEENGSGIMGATLVNTGKVSYPWYTSIWYGIKSTIILTGKILVAFYLLIKGLIIGQSQVAADIAGPIGIAVLTKSFADMGFVYLLQFAALLSINLAIFNFLPLPALDGGRIIFLFIEKFRGGKKVSRKVEGMIHTVGFLVLIGLLVLVSIRDVFKFF